MSASLTDLQKKQLQQAEELLFEGEEKKGFCTELYFGRFNVDAMMPFPEQNENARAAGDSMVAKVKKLCVEFIDADKIDREALIPDGIVKALGNYGVLGMTIDPENGGIGMTQFNYCRVMEIIGGHCGSTAVFVNAHHSIGLRALELFGTPEQKAEWMKPLAAGEKLAAFALTEPMAGRMRATCEPGPNRLPTGRLHSQRRKTLDHQRRNRRCVDRDGPHARSRRSPMARSPPSSSRPT